MVAHDVGRADDVADDLHERLDARGLICPLPVLKARKRLSAMAAGERLEVLTTDPAAPEDFRHFCEATGHRLLVLEEEGDAARMVIARRQE